jgi:hypothetical protein
MATIYTLIIGLTLYGVPLGTLPLSCILGSHFWKLDPYPGCLTAQDCYYCVNGDHRGHWVPG